MPNAFGDDPITGPTPGVVADPSQVQPAPTEPNAFGDLPVAVAPAVAIPAAAPAQPAVELSPFGDPPVAQQTAQPELSPFGDPVAAPTPPVEEERPWAVTRGLVGGTLEQNPTMAAEALEAMSYLAPDTLKGSLSEASQGMRNVAGTPEAYKSTLKTGLFDAPDFQTWFSSLGEQVGQAGATTIPAIGLGVAGAFIGGPAGAITGAAAPSLVFNWGETYKALKDEKVDPATAAEYSLYAAVPMAALDTLSVGPIITRFGGLQTVKREIARGIARRIASEGLKGVKRESITEMTQEAIKDATVSLKSDKPFWTLETAEGIATSGIVGGIVGGGPGAISGVVPDQVEPTFDNAATDGVDMTGFPIHEEPATVPEPQLPPDEGPPGGPTQPPVDPYELARQRQGLPPSTPAAPKTPEEQLAELTEQAKGATKLPPLDTDMTGMTFAERTATVEADFRKREAAFVAEQDPARKLELFESTFTPDERLQLKNKHGPDAVGVSVGEKRIADTGIPMTAEEKYNAAVEEQKVKGQASPTDLAAEERRKGFQVIPGGVPTPPDPQSVPQLPPDDFGSPAVVGLRDPKPSDPYSPITDSVMATVGARANLDTSTHTVVMIGERNPRGSYDLVFGSPADTERDLATYGEINTRVVTASKSDFPADAITAKFEDLPTGSQQGHRVTGSVAARQHLRAAIDSLKFYQRDLTAGLSKDAEMWRRMGHSHYMAFISAGGRVAPPSGGGFVLLNSGDHGAKLKPVGLKDVPRTTRTKATLTKQQAFFAPTQKQPFLMYTRGREDTSPKGNAIDLTRLKPGEMTGLPRAVIKALFSKLPPFSGINVMDKTEQELRDAGVYFVNGENETLWQDTQRLLHRVAIYSDNHLTDREFGKLMERGLRIRVDTETDQFLVTRPAAERASIPGTNLPEPDVVPGYTRGLTQRDKLEVKTEILSKNFIVRPQDRALIRRTAKLVKAVLRKLNIKVDLTIVPVDTKGIVAKGGTERTLGMYHVHHPNNSPTPGKIEIFVNVDGHYVFEDSIIYGRLRQIDKLRLLSTIAHEVGHLLVEYSWNSISFPLKDQIMAAADRMQLSLGLTVGSSKDMVSKSGSIMDLDRFPYGTDWAASPRYVRYWGGLHEFLARGVERHVMKELQVAGPSGRFFRELTGRIRTLFNEFAMEDSNFMEPAAAIKDWIRSMETDPIVQSNLGEITNASMQEAMEPSGSMALPGVEHPRNAMTLETRGALDKIFLGNVPPEFDGVAGGADAFAWTFRKTMSIIRLARYNAERMPMLLRYVGVLRAWEAYKVREAAKHNATLKEWNKLGTKKSDQLTRLIFYMAQQNYRTPFEKAKKVVRYPTGPEISAALRRFGITDPRVWNMFKRVHQEFRDHLDAIEGHALQEVNNLYGGTPAHASKYAEVQAEFARMRKGPYFPMSRFGKFAIWVKDNVTGKLAYAELFATKAERDAAAGRVRRVYPSPRYVMSADKIVDKGLEPFMGMPAFVISKVRQRLTLTKAQAEMLDALSFELGPERSFKKHMLHRDGIPGFSEDAKRAYAEYFLHGTSNLARYMFGEQAQAHVSEIDDYAATLQDPDRVRDMAAFFQDHLATVLNPANDYTMAKSLFFNMYLGYNPKSAFVQLLQIPITGWPHLVATYGGGRSSLQVAIAMGRAAKNIRRLVTDTNFKEDPVKQKARARAIYDNVISPGIMADLAGMASGTLSDTGRNAVGRTVSKVLRNSGWMMTTMEKFCRHVIWDAAYELAGKNLNPKHVNDIVNSPEYKDLYNQILTDQTLNFTPDQVAQLLAGEDATNRTFFTPGQWARPPLLRGKKGLFFTFYTIMLEMLHFFKQDKGGGLGLFMQLMIGGALGMPFADDMNNLIKQMAGWIWGKDVNLERMLREQLVEIFGEDSRIPEMAIHGLAAESLGVSWLMNSMGLPFPRVDLSGSISMGRILPGFAGLDLRTKVGATASSVLGETAMSAAQIPGALVSAFIGVLISPYALDDPKRYEQAMPARIKDMMRAYRMATEGKERNKIGAPVVEWDMNNMQDVMDLTLLAIGDFQPEKLALERRNVREKIESDSFYKARRVTLNQGLYQALDTQDRPTIDKHIKKIQEFNMEVVKNRATAPYAINWKKVEKGYMLRGKVKAMESRGLSPDKMGIPMSQETERIYGGGARIIEKKPVR